MSLWRRRLRLFKSIESMGGNLSVTQTAMERRRRCARRWREPAASRLARARGGRIVLSGSRHGRGVVQ